MQTRQYLLVKLFVFTLACYWTAFSVKASETSSKNTISTSSIEYRFDAQYSPNAALQSTNNQGIPERLQITPDILEEHRQSISHNEYWIYDSWVLLNNDLDHDGYYSKLTIEFDADSIFSTASVYAVIYLGKNNHYESIHTSSVFNIYGEDSSDSFAIDTTLISGFPANDYDILIELYDAFSHTLVAFSDSYDDADLSYVSLESENHEYRYEDTLVVVHEHAGSTSLLSVLMLSVITMVRLKRR